MSNVRVFKRRINNKRVVPIKEVQISKHRVLGKELFSEPYANIYLLAKKKTGKTTTLFNILQECANANTIVIFFVSTLFKDDSYKHIIKWLKDNKIPYIVETSFKKINPATGREFDQFAQLVKFLKNENPDPVWQYLLADDSDSEYESESESEEEELTTHKLSRKYRYRKMEPESDSEDEDTQKELIKKKKTQEIAPELFIIMDDISAELHNETALESLLKENRHIKSKVIISTQGAKDILPTSIAMQDYVLLFSKVPIEHLAHIHKFAKIDLPFDTFLGIYKNAVKPDKRGEKSHNFLYVDTNTGELRQNFAFKYIIDDGSDSDSN